MGGLLLMVAVLFGAGAATADEIASSSCQVEYSPAGAMDGDRFGSQAGGAWRGLVDAVDGWWWQVKFAELRQIGSIQQIHGESGELLTNSLQSYVWQHSDDGIVWRDLMETAIANETRLFRIHRSDAPRRGPVSAVAHRQSAVRVSNAARGRILPGNGLTNRVPRMDPRA